MQYALHIAARKICIILDTFSNRCASVGLLRKALIALAGMPNYSCAIGRLHSAQTVINEVAGLKPRQGQQASFV